MIHSVKIQPHYFNDVLTGRKTFEVRKNDRNYRVGDYIALNEWCDTKKEYTGRCCLVYIDYLIADEYCKEGFVIMSIKPCAVKRYNRNIPHSPFNHPENHSDYEVPLVSDEEEK